MTKYRVLGKLNYQGYRPGDEFEVEMPEDEEQWALDNERVEIVEPEQEEQEDA
jgi:hypothetical protein